MASGSGIFGFFSIEACKKLNLNIEKMYFCDVNAESLSCNAKNCRFNKNILSNVDEIEFRESDLWTSFEEEEKDIKFDIITANFPQTPFHTNFKCKIINNKSLKNSINYIFYHNCR